MESCHSRKGTVVKSNMELRYELISIVNHEGEKVTMMGYDKFVIIQRKLAGG